MHSMVKHYIPILNFLADMLGKDTEIVLQDFSQGFDHSLVYIKNNLSGREIGAPATDFVFEVLKDKRYLTQDYVVNYRSKTINGRELYSSSFFIKNAQAELVGMICMNADKSKLQQLQSLFKESLSCLQDLMDDKEEKSVSMTEEVTENFYSTAENLIEATIAKEAKGKVLRKYNLTRTEKLAIVKFLNQKGFFDLKDAVSKVAEAFRMSEVSIYKYIQIVRQDDIEGK